MAEAVTIPSAELVQEFLTEKGKEVIKKMFYGFESAAMVRKFDGVTDKLDLAEQDVTVDLIREWSWLAFNAHGAPGLHEYLTYTAFERAVIRDEMQRLIAQYTVLIEDRTGLHVLQINVDAAVGQNAIFEQICDDIARDTKIATG